MSQVVLAVKWVSCLVSVSATITTVTNKAIVDYTSPALCTPVTPFPVDPIFSKCGRDGMIPCAARRYWRPNDPFLPWARHTALSMGKKIPSRRQAMRPIVNMLEEEWATDTGNTHKKSGRDRTCGSRDILSDRQTEDALITILHKSSRGWSNNIRLSAVRYCVTCCPFLPECTS